jgi:hypothetical protein
VYKHGPTAGRSPSGFVNPDGILAYNFLIRGAAMYSTITHLLVHDTLPYHMTEPGKIAAVGDHIDIKLKSDNEKELKIVHSGRIGTVITSSISSAPIALPVDDTGSFTRGYTNASNPKLQELPQGSRFFPYFDGMVQPDKTFAFQIFSDIFFPSLFDDISKAPDLLNRIRRGCLNLANKEAGEALSHVYMGIKLSKQSHAALTLVIHRGQYQGFILEGDFTVVLYANKYEGALNEDTKNNIGQLLKHEKAIAEIATMFELAKTEAGEAIYPTTVEDINSSRKFIRKFGRLNLIDFVGVPDFMKTLRQKVSALNYEEKYEPLSTQTLELFLRYVNTGDETLLDNKPAWLDDGMFERTGRVAVGLGMFGNIALSLNYGGKKDICFTLPHDQSAQDPNLILRPDGKRALQYLPFSKVAIGTAVVQWTSLFETGKIYLPTGRKGKDEFTDQRKVQHRVSGEPSFSLLYRLVKDRAVYVRNQKGEKRKRPDGADVTESSETRAKKRRDAARNVEGF